jgi:glucose-1-phosphate adenylyltransferase
VRVEPGAVLDEAIVMDHTRIGAGAQLRRVIVDRYNTIPAGEVIGSDPRRDAQRYHVDASGLVVLPRGRTRGQG